MDLPPPIMKQQVRNLSAVQDIQFLKGGAPSDALGPRLPVLQAFRDFMEAEQRKARRRLQVLALSFLAALLLCLVAGVLAGLYFSRKVNAQVSSLQTEVAAARQESKAMRGDAEMRWNSWQTEASALQKSMEESQAELTGLRSQLASALESATAAPGASPLSALLQEIQFSRSEQLDLETRQSILQNELAQLEAGQQSRDERRARLVEDRSALVKAVEEFSARQQAATTRLESLGQAQAAVDPKATVGRSRRDQPIGVAGSGSEAALVVLEDLHRLRSEQLDLRARQALLQKELDDLDAEQRLSDLRRQRLDQQRGELAAKVETFLARQRDLQERLQNLRGTTAPVKDSVESALDLIK